MALFVLPWTYIPDPTQGRPVFNGKLYFGIADQDPELFPKDVELVQEDGSSIIAEQPISTNSGGTPTYNGSPVAINLLDGDYSLKILNSNGVQVYYYASLIATDNNLTENALRAAALRLNLNAALIGTVLITNDGGNDLDNAEYLIDTITGLLYSLPDDIPAGSTVVSSSGATLVTSNGQFEMNPVWHYAVNRLIGNQIPVVEGSTGDPLPSAVATAYAINSEPAAGYEFVTAATNVTFDAGLWKGTGQLQRKYKRDAAGFISKSSEYAGVRLYDDTQLRALVDDIATNGCSVTDDVDYVYVTFELSDFPSGVKFPFIAAEVGVIAEIGEDESLFSSYDFGRGAPYIDPDAVGANPSAVIYPDGTIVGSTDNGNYTKFPNGDLVCRALDSSVYTASFASGSIFNVLAGVILFPVEFLSLPIVAPRCAGTSTDIVWGALVSVSLTSVQYRLLASISGSEGRQGYLAYGRWK